MAGPMAEVFAGLGDYLAESPDIDWEPSLDEVAAEVAGFARGFAAAHNQTGDYLDSIEVQIDRESPSGRDRLIVATDPAAAVIEFGHVAPDGTFVAGLHIMGRAADAVGGER